MPDVVEKLRGRTGISGIAGSATRAAGLQRKDRPRDLDADPVGRRRGDEQGERLARPPSPLPLRRGGAGYGPVMDQDQAPIVEALAAYHAENRYGFTPPGHR